MDAVPTQIHEEQVGENIQITEADANAVIKSLKIEKAHGENDIELDVERIWRTKADSCLLGSIEDWLGTKAMDN